MPCDIKYQPPISDDLAKRGINALQMQGMPAATVKAAQDYAIELRKKHPMISAQTMAKRIQQKFNIEIMNL